MRHLFLFPVVFAVLVGPAPAQTEAGLADGLQPGPAGEAYQETLRLSTVDAEVAYLDPTRSLPALSTDAAPDPAPGPDGRLTLPTPDRVVLYLLLAGVLLGIAFLVFTNAGRVTLSLGGAAANPARARAGAGRGVKGIAGVEVPTDLQAILGLADRRAALVLLAQAALGRTVEAQGVLFQSSWTMRDALRHLPRGLAHLDALRQLVLAGERVLFGNRDVTEEEFQAHVARVRPLLQPAGPA